MTNRSPFRYFKTSPDIIRLAVMLYVRFPLSLRNVEDLLHERGIDVSHETVRFWWNRFGPMFAAEKRRKRVSRMGCYSNWRWHLDEVFVKINVKRHYLWRGRSRRGGAGKLCDEAPRSRRSSSVLEESDENIWVTGSHRDRQIAFVWCRDEGYWECGEARNRPL
ncbi:hypothetical protein CLV88_11219 [Shimia abyssi]|uniref:Transposase n=1 Tax=Shimia abyssi TaxID=1662395 RepID=A0A2P8F8R8_9RHOB|nr:hypothetical protein CLV88_11219 [Shimia abyssi]